MNQRDQAIADSMRAGMTRNNAALLFDVSFHAFNEGWAAVRRITETAPPPAQAAIIASALASFTDLFRGSFPEEWAAFVATPTDDPGTTTVIIMGDETPARQGPPDFGPGRMA